MNVPESVLIENEQKRKAEAIESLVVDICEGPPDNVSTVFRTALERGWREDLQTALRAYEAKKQAEISRICNRHYSGFIGSAEELLKMRADLAELSSQISGLNAEVQLTGRGALAATRTLLRQRHAASNVAATSAMVAKCSSIVSTVMEAFVHIHEERYYTALNTLDSIQRSLTSLGGIRFAIQLRSWMPSIAEVIDQATKEEMSQWLLDIREASYHIGAAAMRRYAGLRVVDKLGDSDKRSELQGGQKYPQKDNQTYSIRCLVQLEDLLGCGLRLEESELDEFVPGFMGPGDRKVQAEEDRALDHLSDYLHPVHRALHIFARLGMLDEFKAWYFERRQPMAELRSMVTRDLDHLDTEGFLTYLPTLVHGIMGFFIVEDALMRKVDHKDGIMSLSQVEKAWRRSQASLRDLIEHHMSGLSRPGHFMQLKETLLAMAKLTADLDLDCKSLMELLRKLKDPYQKLLLLAFEGECRRIMQDESYQPLELQSEEEFEGFLVPLGLDDFLNEDASATDDSLGLTFMSSSGMRMNSSRRRYPLTCPFSATVPELGFSLLKLSGLMIAFLSHVDSRNGGTAVFEILELGTAVIRQIMLELLQGAESDSHILKAAQISTNSSYAAKLPIHLATVMWECLADLQFSESAAAYDGTSAGTMGGTPGGVIGGIYDKEGTFKGLYASSRALEGIADRARDLIFELVRDKADQLLAGMEFIKWEPPSVRQFPHSYCEDLISYLRVTFMNLSSLPPSMRDAAHFTCMTHVCNYMLQELLSYRCPSINILGIFNLSKDVSALVSFCDESGISQLGFCFHKLSQLLDIILNNDPEVITDPVKRMREYPRLDVHHLVELFEKYKNLSLAARIKNTIGDEVPQLEQKFVKQLLVQLREHL